MRKSIAELIRRDKPLVFRITPALEMLIDSNERCVIDTLKEHGLYRSDLIYRGVNVSNWQGILTSGTDRAGLNYDYNKSDYAEANLELIRRGFKPGDFFYGGAESQLGTGDADDPIDCAFFGGEGTPVLIVYDPDKVVDKRGEQPDLYFFKDGKKKGALVALFVWEDIQLFY